MLNELSARITTWVMAAREESGQGLVEYALILVLVSIAAIVTLELLGATSRHLHRHLGRRSTRA